MKYWLFTVMYDWFPSLWPTLLKQGLAAQHYPKGWTNEIRNLNALQQLKAGDRIVAALMKHRFAAHGVLVSDFFRSGRSLSIRGDGESLAFRERAGVRWTAIPLEKTPPYIACAYLKQKGYNIDLTRGLCVKEIDRRTFAKLESLLDLAGAKSACAKSSLDTSRVASEPVLFLEGKSVTTQARRAERNPAAREECIRVHGKVCSVCAFDFQQQYGEIGNGYIQVHHLAPISKSKGPHLLDPAKDLRPLCPNCHAMIHRTDPPMSVDELKRMVTRI